jgi:hypothetical protein
MTDVRVSERCLGGLSSVDTPDESPRPIVYRENVLSMTMYLESNSLSSSRYSNFLKPQLQAAEKVSGGKEGYVL